MRKAKPKKRILLPDPKFGDVSVTRFVNNLMLDGKKSIAYTIFYDALELVGKKMKDADKSPLEIWKQALENITPQVEVKSKRIGGATFQVPMEVRPCLLYTSVDDLARHDDDLFRGFAFEPFLRFGQRHDVGLHLGGCQRRGVLFLEAEFAVDRNRVFECALREVLLVVDRIVGRADRGGVSQRRPKLLGDMGREGADLHFLPFV